MAEDLGQYLPKINIQTPALIRFGTWAILFLIFVIIVGVATFFLIKRMKFNKKIVIFERINGRWEATKRDRAMEFRFGTGGDTVFLLSKLKKYIPTPSIQTGRNTYWMFIREDGEMINFELTDLDELSKKMGARFLDKEMRYARVSLQRQLKDRYTKTGFLEKYGGLIAYVSLIAVTGIMMYLLFDKFLEIGNSLAGAVDAARTVQESTNQILGNLDNVCTGGSGLIPT